MGGTVAVTIREKDGSLIKMCRWTNIFPHTVFDERFIKNDDGYFKEVIAQWQEMRDDYIKHKKDRKFEHNMTECYATDDCMVCAPVSYGLIFIDRQNQEIHHCQGYTSFELTYPSAYSIQKSGNVLGMKFPEESEFPFLANDKRLARVLWDGKQWKFIEEIQSLQHFDKVCEEIINKNTLKAMQVLNLHDSFLVKLAPWKVFRYDETKEGFKKFKKELEKRGVKFNKKDEEAWKEFLRDRYES